MENLHTSPARRNDGSAKTQPLPPDADRLKAVRSASKITWAALASLLHLKPAKVRQVLAGKKLLSPRGLLRLERLESKAGLGDKPEVTFTMNREDLDLISRMLAECQKTHNSKALYWHTGAFINRTAVEAAKDWWAGLDHKCSAAQFAQLVYELREEIFQNIFDLGDKNKRARLAMALQDVEQYLIATGKPVDRGATPIDNFAREMMDDSTLGLAPK